MRLGIPTLVILSRMGDTAARGALHLLDAGAADEVWCLGGRIRAFTRSGAW